MRQTRTGAGVLLALLLMQLLPLGTASYCAAAEPLPQKRVAALGAVLKRGNAGECRTALAECAVLVQLPGLTPELRRQVRMLEVGLLARAGDEAATSAAARRLEADYPGDAPVGQAALMAEHDLLRAAKKWELAAAKASEAAVKFAGDKPFAAQAWTKAADAQFRLKAWDAAFESAARALQADALVARETLDGAYHYQSEAAFSAGKFEVCAQVLRPVIDAWPEHRRARQFQDRCIDSLWKLKRYDEVRALLARVIQLRESPVERQQLAMRVGWSFVEQQRYDEALAAFEKVFTEHPQVSDGWRDAQGALVDVYRRKGEREKALQAARVLLDAAADREAFLRAVQVAGDILRELEPKAGKDKALQAYQLLGKDGGVPDPLAQVAYPDLAARRAAFAKAESELGFESDDFCLRARMRLYGGEPQQALAFYLQALRRAGPADYLQDYGRIAGEVVWAGARAWTGCAGGLEPFFAFLLNGPAGADGKSATADDLLDPFATLVAPDARSAPAAANIPQTVQRELEQAQAHLLDLVRDADESVHRREQALWGLRRINESLNAWPSLLAFYESALSDKERRLQELVLVGRLAVAKADACHLGGIRQLLEQDARAAGWQELNVLKNYRKLLEQFLKKQTLPEKFGRGK